MREHTIIIEGKETNYIAYENGTIKNLKTNRILKGSITNEGYQRIQLLIEGKNKSILGHKIIAEYFVENPNNYKYVTHINGDRADNRAENLKWIENIVKTKTTNVKTNNSYSLKEVSLDLNDWKPLEFFPQYYVGKTGLLYNSKTGKYSKGNLRCGYRRKEIGGHVYSIHRLVYEAFNGPIPEGMVIDHIDGNKENNNIDNLRCITQSENMKHAYANGHKGQTPIKQYDLNHNYIKTYPSCTAAAQEFGVSYRAISSAAERGGTSCGYYWKKEEQ